MKLVFFAFSLLLALKAHSMTIEECKPLIKNIDGQLTTLILQGESIELNAIEEFLLLSATVGSYVHSTKDLFGNIRLQEASTEIRRGSVVRGPTDCEAHDNFMLKRYCAVGEKNQNARCSYVCVQWTFWDDCR